MEPSRQAPLVLVLALLALTAGCVDGAVGPTPNSADAASPTPVVTPEKTPGSTADEDASRPTPDSRTASPPESDADFENYRTSVDVSVPAPPRTPDADSDIGPDVEVESNVEMGSDASTDSGGDATTDGGEVVESSTPAPAVAPVSDPVPTSEPTAPVADDSAAVPAEEDGSASSATDPTTAVTTMTGTVVGVVDGDTIRVQFDDGGVATVDLAGVDAPELYTSTDPTLFAPVPNSERGTTYLHVWGWIADRAVASRLLGESVEVEIVDDDTATDASAEPDVVSETSETGYVAYVTAEGAASSANLGLVEAGLARATGDDHPRRDRFAAAEAAAREAAVGLWDVSEPLSVP